MLEPCETLQMSWIVPVVVEGFEYRKQFENKWFRQGCFICPSAQREEHLCIGDRVLQCTVAVRPLWLKSFGHLNSTTRMRFFTV